MDLRCSTLCKARKHCAVMGEHMQTSWMDSCDPTLSHVRFAAGNDGSERADGHRDYLFRFAKETA